MSNHLEKYKKALRAGKSEEARKHYLAYRDGKEEVVDEVEAEPVEESSEEEEESEVSEQVAEKDKDDLEKYRALNGVGDELARELVETFESYDAFAEHASAEDLEPIPGIGKKRAESLVEQVGR